MPGDIFATKGLEYLIVVAYLLLLVGLAWAVTLPRFGGRVAAAARRAARGPVAWFRVADGYGFHPGHAWAAPVEGRLVKVGLDDFAAQLLGDPDGLELPAPGAALRQGGPGWKVRSGARELPMLSPVEGEVVAVNPAVAREPRLAAADPYGEGWLLQVRVPDRRGWWQNLLSGELASVWMAHTADRLRRLQDGGLGVVMPDGGMPVRGFAHGLDQAQWEAVAKDFFLVG